VGFTNQERINQNSKILAASVLDANEVAQWYESRFPNEFVVSGDKVWLQLATLVRLHPAASVSEAQAKCTGPLLGVVEDRSLPAMAVRLTPVAGTNNSTFVAYEVYDSPTSKRIDNWLQPQMVPQASGVPSFGYSMRLYKGNPASGGTEIATTDGVSGTGVNKSVGWVWNYANGMLFLAADFRATITDPTQLYVTGFRYVGATLGASSGGGTAREDKTLTYTTTQMAVGAILDFELATGPYIDLIDLSLSNVATVECHSTSERNDKNPYQFIGIKTHLSDDGTYVTDGNRYFGPRYVTLYNREDSKQTNTYWRLRNTHTQPQIITLTIRYLKL
jgi:hypothetical protein